LLVQALAVMGCTLNMWHPQSVVPSSSRSSDLRRAAKRLRLLVTVVLAALRLRGRKDRLREASEASRTTHWLVDSAILPAGRLLRGVSTPSYWLEGPAAIASRRLLNMRKLASAVIATHRLRGDSAPPRVAVAHDAFNLLALPLLMSLNLATWDLRSAASQPAGALLDYGTYASLWRSAAQGAFVQCCYAYFLLDLAFIGLFPACVKSPRTVLAHHVVVLLVVSFALLEPRIMPYFSLGMLVELNTVLLITRRLLMGACFRGAAAARALNSSLFYLSWVALRLLLFPLMALAIGPRHARLEIHAAGGFATLMALKAAAAIAFGLGFVALNVNWSVALFASFHRRYLRGGDGRSPAKKYL